MKGKNQSIKRIIDTLSGVVIGFMVIIGALSVMFALFTNRVSEYIAGGFRDLSECFSNVQRSVSYLNHYLSYENPANLDQAMELLDKAEQSIQSLEENPLYDTDLPLLPIRTGLQDVENRLTGIAIEQTSFEDIASIKSSLTHWLSREPALVSWLSEKLTNYQEAVDRIENVFLFIWITIVMIVLLFGISLHRRSTVLISRPLKRISLMIADLPENNPPAMEEPSDTGSIELLQIEKALHEIAGKLEQNRQEIMHMAELEARLAQSELRLLQNQINPHFLFNTLNTIYCMCEIEDAPIAADMMLKTSHLLRYAMEGSSRIFYLSREIQIAQYYIDIQKIRLQDQVSFEVRLPQKPLGSIRIPAMVLQPLIENSIKHGMKNKTSGGIVVMDVSFQNQDLIIEISDNGEGMDERELKNLIENDYRLPQSGLGLYNVIHRLKLYYKEACAISIGSEKGRGFRVRIQIDTSRIPNAEKGKDEEIEYSDYRR